MAFFLKAVSGLYLVLIWAFYAVALSMSSLTSLGGKPILLLACIGLSIPAAVLFGFAQIVGDIRIMRNEARLQTDHLEAMHNYYEPQQR